MFGFHHHHHHGRGWHAMRGGWAHGRGFGGFDEDGTRGRRRMFEGGDLRLVLLRLIADRPSHGYDLIRAIEARTGGAYAPSPGVVYPALTMLGDMELIDERPGEGARRIFAVAAAGEALLVERAAEIAELMRRLDAVGAMRERTDGGAVRRAMHNLKAVLRNKLGEDTPDRAVIDQAVALIDEAAQRIERL